MILAIAVFLGVLKASLESLLGRELSLALMTGYVPCFVVAGLIISIAVHRLSEMVRPQEEDASCEERSGNTARGEVLVKGEKEAATIKEECWRTASAKFSWRCRLKVSCISGLP